MADRNDIHTNQPTTIERAGWIIKRISWGAIIAGAIVVLIVHLTLALLGIAVGLWTVEPATQAEPFRGVGTGMAIWWVISGLIALFLGGWLAAYLAGFPKRFDGVVHGFLVWSLATLITVYMLTTALGTVIGGAMGTVQAGLQPATEAIAASDAGIVPMALGDELTWQDIRLEIQALSTQADNPRQTEEQLTGATDQLLRQGRQGLTASNRHQTVTILSARTDLDRDEAVATVDRWILSYEETAPELRDAGMEAVQRAATPVIEATSRAALWTFLMLIIGAVVAALGGAAGIHGPDYRETEERRPTV